MTDKPAISADWFRAQIGQYRAILRSIDDREYTTGDVGRDGVISDQTPELRAICEQVIEGLEAALKMLEIDSR
ncbi:hypothetical protein [Labrys neptuniae]|uniref:Uncharacterized protein n=1 Tax=Labrys neptuniae TaxID=376174 RepID=A0ABV3PRT8_9HYPH